MPSFTLRTRVAALLAAAVAATTYAVAGPAVDAEARGTAASTDVSADQQAFLAVAVPAARASRRATGVPASVTIAQAILESGWGRASLTRATHNYFGIKCFGTRGPNATGCVTVQTEEYVGSRAVTRRHMFRRYSNAAASFTDHGAFLRGNARYRRAFAHAGDPDQFIREVQRAGYATDPSYADRVIAVMTRYNLYRYDR